MLFQYFTHVPLPLGTVESRIDEVRASLEEWADIAYRDGEELRATVGPGPNSRAKTVRLDIGMAEVRRSGIIYPVTWTAVGASGLFPRLSADLVLSHVGKSRTRVALEGTYDPPLGPIGRAIDRLALRNVAEATIQDWVDRVATAVSDGAMSAEGQ
jgi:hypothetical protein